ncbi:hypothetical protein BMR1_02g01306 [Babesia microti strain RI]|uniref:Uncharacterized protein n=1 Tax=Babesia microti (strain RI) TaxID=1133968 RepID=A0A1R4AA66_BABMR|nr:hypothetical protein BMR1_02g01306 [Babesia microti strain RI]SJK85892.1 hypothetical protein BMR1_02g01306 [Babesia microti strain RI]|eukprot:XP_021338103.1 hypothetical protein BMR1_02g01306 [Babesia microti strain RI]
MDQGSIYNGDEYRRDKLSITIDMIIFVIFIIHIMGSIIFMCKMASYKRNYIYTSVTHR